jgi:cell division protein FtsB
MNIYDKLSRMIVTLLMLAGIFAVVLWYRPVIKENEQYRKTKLELDRKIEKELEIAKSQDAFARALQDPKTVERLARERLSYAKPGETIIHFEPPSTASTR